MIAVIPARWESSRFPGKPMADIAGKTMIERVYTQTKACKEIHDVFVATDSEMIYDHVIGFGGKALMTGNCDNGTARVAEALQKLGQKYDVVINVQGDQPVLKPTVLDELVNAFRSPSVQIATLAKKSGDSVLYHNPHVVKVIMDANNNALYFSRSPLPHHSPGNFYYHIGIYAFRPATLKEIIRLTPSPGEETEKLEQLRWLHHGYPIHIVETKYDVPAVDVPEDIEKVLRLL